MYNAWLFDFSVEILCWFTGQPVQTSPFLTLIGQPAYQSYNSMPWMKPSALQRFPSRLKRQRADQSHSLQPRRWPLVKRHSCRLRRKPAIQREQSVCQATSSGWDGGYCLRALFSGWDGWSHPSSTVDATSARYITLVMALPPDSTLNIDMPAGLTSDITLASSSATDVTLSSSFASVFAGCLCRLHRSPFCLRYWHCSPSDHAVISLCLHGVLSTSLCLGGCYCLLVHHQLLCFPCMSPALHHASIGVCCGHCFRLVLGLNVWTDPRARATHCQNYECQELLLRGAWIMSWICSLQLLDPCMLGMCSVSPTA